MYPNQIVHKLVNEERRKRKLPYVRWSQEMYKLAKSQTNYCAKVGKLVHSDRHALMGGENLCGGKGKLSPRSIVKCWMSSKAGHREWLLDPRVKVAGVAISASRHGTYVAWAFSGDTTGVGDITLPTPIEIVNNIKKWFVWNIIHRLQKGNKVKGGEGMLRKPIKYMSAIGALFAIALGGHGLWVYFNTVETLFGGNASKLFLVIDMPARLQDAVLWMSMKGIDSWFIPVVFIVGGIMLWSWQSDIYAGERPNWLRRLW